MCVSSPDFLDLFFLPSILPVLVLGHHRGPRAIILVIVGADSNVTLKQARGVSKTAKKKKNLPGSLDPIPERNKERKDACGIFVACSTNKCKYINKN